MKRLSSLLLLMFCGFLFLTCSGRDGEGDRALEKTLLRASEILLRLGEKEDALRLFAYGRDFFPGFTDPENPGERLAVAALQLEMEDGSGVDELFSSLLASKETELETMVLLFKRGKAEERYEWGCRLLHHRANPMSVEELLSLGEEAIGREDFATAEEVMEHLSERRSAFPYLLLNRYLAEARSQALSLLCRSGELQLFLLERGEGGSGLPDLSWAGEIGESDLEGVAALLESFINRDYLESQERFLQLEPLLKSREEPSPDFLTLVELVSGMEAASSRSDSKEEINRLLRDYLALEKRFFYSQTYYLAGARFALVVGDREALFESCCEKAIALAPSSPAALEARALLASRYQVSGFFLLPEESLSIAASPVTKTYPYLFTLILPMLEASPGRFRLAAEAAILQGLEDVAGRSFLKSLLPEEDLFFSGRGNTPGVPGGTKALERLQALLGTD